MAFQVHAFSVTREFHSVLKDFETEDGARDCFAAERDRLKFAGWEEQPGFNADHITFRKGAWYAYLSLRDLDAPEEPGEPKMRIRIDGELYTVDSVRDLSDGGISLAEIETEEGPEFVLFESSEEAGKAARYRWQEMAENDPSEFRAMVGDETLVRWAMGQYAGPGSTQVCSLEEWLDLHLDCPAEEFASYDSEEREVERVGRLRDELGFVPGVAYRCG